MRVRSVSLATAFRVFEALVIVGLLALAGCAKNSAAPVSPKADGPGSSSASSYRYLVFLVTSGNPPRGGPFRVAIYDQLTRDRIVLGGSDPVGNFSSLRVLDASKRYRVEIYLIPNSDCVMAFWDVSLATTPSLWTSNAQAAPTSSVHLGTVPTHANGCWGS